MGGKIAQVKKNKMTFYEIDKFDVDFFSVLALFQNEMEQEKEKEEEVVPKGVAAGGRGRRESRRR